MPDIKLKGCRPIEEINVEYSQMCGLIGDASHKKSLIDRDIIKFLKRQDELDLEAQAYHKQVNGSKPVPAPSLEELSESSTPNLDKADAVIEQMKADIADSIAQEATT